jgi:NAD binding domain of 6-phosphogluconate dehydrogenase
MDTNNNRNNKNLQVGFVGLGDQGVPMAIAIAEAGWPLRVWARHERSYEALGDVSYERCETVEELGHRADVVGLCLTDDADVWQLLDDKRLLSALPPGGIVVNHGTGDPQVAIELARHGDANGHTIIDAPVSGGRPAAERKALTTFVGGDPKAAETCRPLFEAFSTTIAYMGQAGAGQMTKLMNNASLWPTSATPRRSSPSASRPASIRATSSTCCRQTTDRALRCNSSEVRSRPRLRATCPIYGARTSATSQTRSAAAISLRPCSKRERTRPSLASFRHSTRSHPSGTEQPATARCCCETTHVPRQRRVPRARFACTIGTHLRRRPRIRLGRRAGAGAPRPVAAPVRDCRSSASS